MKYGYARVSTSTQAKDGNSLDGQVMALRAAGAQAVFKETYTGTKTERPELTKLLSSLHTGDTLIVTKLDRIARSASKGIDLVNTLLHQGVVVHILNMGILDDSPTGKLISAIFLAFAEFERDMIVERTTEGKALARQRAKSMGKLFLEGRPKKYSRAQIDHAISLLSDNSYTQVAQMTGISKSTLIRYKKNY